MTIDTAKLKVSTKALVSAAVTLGGLSQVPAVNKLLTGLANAHPRLAPVVVVVTTVWTLLHNPQVQDALGMKHTVEVVDKTETVELAEQPQVKP